ncbi:UbiH/UbiF/VisC/COQ6 family ubiquinone biosynthesis hydroxylase [Saccharospirillum mangrovi]|uniref:UbiH/UbiF/VisC/COQ6 family ubiquinone biosynthesis hydroxylase n=1 Tax=Saccharospirillum mangrovi TaxID=2161747 RepID=UPI000D362E52|nr:UbiH/UbiF/VisC/COQ6 family ubiquinone biosynthesis hydroxylase [Saccharospirillum mangrovi]
MNTTVDAVIVGGGMVGLSLAVASAEQGLSVALIEPHRAEPVAPQPSQFAPRVSAISPHNRQWLTQLDAWQRIPAARVCAYPAMRVWDGQGQGAIEFHASEVGAEQLGQIVENHWITQALWERVDALPKVQQLIGRRLQEWRVEPDGVAIELDDGSRFQAAVLAGCDGKFSGIRQQAGFATREWDYGQTALVTSIRHSAPHAHTARQVFLDTGPLAFLPLSDDSGSQHWSSIVWSADTSRAETLFALDDAAFLAELNRASEGCLGEIEHSDRRFRFPLAQMHSVDYIQDRLVLLGDAAHAIHPLAGQGVNLGFRDAEVLAQEWGRAKRLQLSCGDSAVLRRFQRRRQTHNLTTMAAMEGFKRLFGSPHPLAVLARNLGMQGLASQRWAKRAIIEAATS